jgi:hypothetical protein
MNQLTNSKLVSLTYSLDHNDGVHKEISERETSGPNSSNTNTITNTSSTTTTTTSTIDCTGDPDGDSYTSPTATAAITESYAETADSSWWLRLWKEVR